MKFEVDHLKCSSLNRGFYKLCIILISLVENVQNEILLLFACVTLERVNAPKRILHRLVCEHGCLLAR